MSNDKIFTAVRNSPAFLKPPPLPPGAGAAASESFGCTLAVLAYGWIPVFVITLVLGFSLQRRESMILFILAVLTNVVIAVVMGMLWLSHSRSTVDAFPVIVTRKQHERYNYSGSEGGGGASDYYYLTLQFEDGTQAEHGVSEEMFFRVQTPCAGVAHLHSYEGMLVRYDAVLDTL